MANFVTKQGLEDLKKEYDIVINVKIPKNLEQLNAALELGDLRENSERDTTLTEQERLNIRKQEIEDILNDYTLIDEETELAGKGKSVIRIGSHVKIEYTDREEIYEVKIMGSSEADVLSEIIKISNESPLANAIIGKTTGDKVTFKVKNKIHAVKILEIISQI